MLTKDDLEQIAGLIKTSEERLGKRIEAVDNKVGAAETSLTKKIETIDLKVEVVHEFNKKAHAETMETLLDIGSFCSSPRKGKITSKKHFSHYSG